MNFLYSSFLYALGLLAIPVIIHLFYFRRFKTVYFSNIDFLKTLKEETSARSKVKNLVVLSLRLLALAAVIFAFAQPFLSKNTAGDLRQKAVSVFVDNSFSMQAKNGEAELFEIAKNKAREIIEAYDESNQFHVFSHDMLPQNQRLVSKEDALTIVESFKLTPKVQLSKQIFEKQRRILKGDKKKKAYFVSDFQKSIFEENINLDTTISTTFVFLKAVKESNLSIDSCWFESPIIPNQPNKLVARFHNYSSEDQDINAHLQYMGQNFPMGTKLIKANSSILDTISMNISQSGWQEATLSITDYPISFDDDFYFTFLVSQKLNILSINGVSANKYINAAFQKSDYTDLNNVLSSKVQFSAFDKQDLIVLNEVQNLSSGLISSLEKYVSNGGNLIFFPNENGNIQQYNSLMKNMNADNVGDFVNDVKSVNKINTQAFIFKDVYKGRLKNINLPTTQKSLKFINRFLSAKEYLLKYKDGSDFVSKYTHNQGHFVVCSTPLNERVNDLVKNAEIFVPLIYRTAISKGFEVQLSYTIGRDAAIELSPKEEMAEELVFKIKNEKGYEFIPKSYKRRGKIVLNSMGQVNQSGFYNVNLGGTLQAKLAYNFDRIESDMDFYNKTDLSKLMGGNIEILDDLETNNLSDLIKSKRDNALWRWLIIAALLFLFIETLVLRFWKV